MTATARYFAEAIAADPWHRAEEDGNPQGYTYGPGQPFTRTRAQFSRELREEIAAGRAEERADAILRRDLHTA